MTDPMERESRRAESAQLARQWAILRLLAESGRAFSVAELADQLGVLSFGAHAELKTPASWRQAIGETARALADRHADPGST